MKSGFKISVSLMWLCTFFMFGSAASQEHSLFTDILSKYSKNGLVDYQRLKADKLLDKYLSQLSAVNPDKLNRNQKLAFWINAYNAFTIQVIRDNYPVESITDLHTGGKVIGFLIGKTVWDKAFINISGKKYSLNDIEHKILRKMNEPRIHFAIVCASVSCPALRNEAFEDAVIEAQLQDEAVKFINDKTRNSFDAGRRRANISKIFDWFGEDFGKTDEKILRYIAGFLTGNLKSDIEKNASSWKISFNDYDWNLNEIK